MRAPAVISMPRLHFDTYSRTETNRLAPAPRVAEVRFTSDPGAEGSYRTGDVVEVTVTFDQAVTVTGDVRIGVDVGGAAVAAAYRSALSSAKALVFRYTVEASDRDGDGVSIARNILPLAGLVDDATIRNAAGVDAVLDHAAVAGGAGQRVNVFVPDKPAGLSAQAGEGEVALSWTTGGDGGSAIVRHQYRVKAGSGAYGVWQDIATSAAGEAHAGGYTVAGLDNGIAHTFRVRAVNAAGGGPASEPASATPRTPPRVAGVAITSDPGADETYVTGDVIEVTVTFDQAVTRAGGMILPLTVGNEGAPSHASSRFGRDGAGVRYHF